MGGRPSENVFRRLFFIFVGCGFEKYPVKNRNIPFSLDYIPPDALKKSAPSEAEKLQSDTMSGLRILFKGLRKRQEGAGRSEAEILAIWDIVLPTLKPVK